MVKIETVIAYDRSDLDLINKTGCSLIACVDVIWDNGEYNDTGAAVWYKLPDSSREYSTTGKTFNTNRRKAGRERLVELSLGRFTSDDYEYTIPAQTFYARYEGIPDTTNKSYTLPSFTISRDLYIHRDDNIGPIENKTYTFYCVNNTYQELTVKITDEKGKVYYEGKRTTPNEVSYPEITFTEEVMNKMYPDMYWDTDEKYLKFHGCILVETTINSKKVIAFQHINCIANGKAPTILNFELYDTDQSVVALTGDKNKIVRYLSDIYTACSWQTYNNTTLEESSITIDGTRFSNVPNANKSDIYEDTIKYWAKDSRGVQANINYKIPNFIQYIKPTVYFEAKIDTNGKLTVNIEGKCFTGSFGAVNNQLTCQLRYNNNSWINVPITASSSQYTAYYEITISNYDYTQAVTVEVQVADKVITLPIVMQRVTSNPIIQWDNKRLDIYIPTYVKKPELFYRTSNQSFPIQLNKNIREFAFIEIFYTVDYQAGFVRVPLRSNGINEFTISHFGPSSSPSKVYLDFLNLSVAGSTISLNEQKQIVFDITNKNISQVYNVSDIEIEYVRGVHDYRWGGSV